MALWTPEYIPLKLWLCANDESSLTVTSGRATRWRDKLVASRELVSSTGPQVISNGLNGKTVLRFGGNNSHAFQANGLLPAGEVVAYCVFNKPSSGGAQYQRVYSSDNGSGNDYLNQGVYAFPPTSSNGIGAGGPFLLEGYYGGSFLSFVRFKVGGLAESTGLSYFGDLGELVITDGKLSIADKLRLEGYLAHYWDITSLLSDEHPYKNSAPTVPFVSGVITDRLGNPCQRKVYAMSRPTNEAAPLVLAHGLSDPETGAYELIVPSGEEVTRVVVSEGNGTDPDTDPALLPDLVDRITPEYSE